MVKFMLVAFLIVAFCCQPVQGDAQGSIESASPIKKFTSWQEIKGMKRTVPSQGKLDNKKNLGISNLKDLELKKATYKNYNFSFSNFERANISNAVFIDCNFSFCENMDKAIVSKNTKFLGQCNFSGIPEDELPSDPAVIEKTCHRYPMTDNQIKDFFADVNL